jgi:hypothetical protein
MGAYFSLRLLGLEHDALLLMGLISCIATSLRRLG